jgi:UDP-GlcNAc:undecaprenyl-phosphate GlcNAc-1-phosphate transferase
MGSMVLTLNVVIAIALAVGIPFALTPLIGKLALAAGVVDKPGGRKVHDGPIPSWGGLGIFLGFVVAAVYLLPLEHELVGLILGGALILVLGMIDDWKELSPLGKLLGQIAAATVMVLFGVTVRFVTNPFGGIIHLGVFSIPLTIGWIVAITNALNLVDGLDGLAAGIATIAASTVAVVAFGQHNPEVGFCAVLLAASSLGFLPHNFHPAKIFMGDTGSLFLGFILASLSVFGLTKSATAFSIILPILILGIPIFDMLFAIVRRVLKGQHIYTADRDHLHYRLLAVGLTHRQTVVVIYLVNLLLGGSAILLTYLTTDQGLVVLLCLLSAILYAANKVGLFAVDSPVLHPRPGHHHSDTE